jgi:serine/threonine protein kinase
MAPEQITMPETVDHRADIYSTGLVFYVMLTGELPAAVWVPPSRKAASDPRLDPIIYHAIQRDRDQRYPEARLMYRDIISLSRTRETTIRIEQFIVAPPEQVFVVWIDPAEMAD